MIIEFIRIICQRFAFSLQQSSSYVRLCRICMNPTRVSKTIKGHSLLHLKGKQNLKWAENADKLSES